MDTSFFGEMTLTLVRDVTNKENLIWQFSNSENKNTYGYLYNKIIYQGIDVMGIVVDGRPYFYEMFGDVPVQMCHFHMAKILSRYLTRSPRLEVNKALWDIWNKREKYKYKGFERMLRAWCNSFEYELNEKYEDKNGKQQYVRLRTRKAYRSLIKYTPWLFTYLDNHFIPKTNNSLEGVFGGIKRKLNVHNGLSIGRKMKVIHHLLSQK